MSDYLQPERGVRVPSRREMTNLIQRIATDAAISDDDSIDQPLAEQMAQYLDAIYTALRFLPKEPA